MPAGSDTVVRAEPRRPAPSPVRPAARLAWSFDAGEGSGALIDPSYSDRTIRLLTVAPLAVLAAGVGVQLSQTAIYNRGAHSTLLTVALMACYLPMVGYQVWSAAHLRRPRLGWWMLAATAVVIAAGVVLIGNEWQLTIAYLLVSTLIVVPRPWSIVAGCAILAAAAPVDLLVDPTPNPLWKVLVIVQRAGAVLVPAWFAGTLRELRATRQLLADQAVLRERGRFDRELVRAVGDSLEGIAERGAVAATLTEADPDGARRELRTMVDNSRRTLAEARRLIRAYQRVPLRAELDTAVTLLSAAGVSARLVLPGDGLPRHADAELREALRAAVDRLLREPPARTYVITVDTSAGRPRLTVAPEGAGR